MARKPSSPEDGNTAHGGAEDGTPDIATTADDTATPAESLTAPASTARTAKATTSAPQKTAPKKTAAQQPATKKPATSKPVAKKPAAESLPSGSAAAESIAAENGAVENSARDETAIENATAESPATDSTAIGQPAAESPAFAGAYSGSPENGTPAHAAPGNGYDAPTYAAPGIDPGTPAGPPPGAGGQAPWPSPDAPEGAAPGGATGNRFFSWMRSLDIPRQPGWIGGVCAGIASRLGIDPLIVRGIFVVIAVFGGPALLLYAAGWLLLPDNRNKIHLEEVFRGHLEAPIAGIGAIILLAMLPITQGFWFAESFYWDGPHWGAVVGRTVWTLILIGLIVAFVIWIARRSKEGKSGPAFAASPADAAASTIPQPAAPAFAAPTAFTAPAFTPGTPNSTPTAAFAAGTSGTPTAPTAPIAPGPNAPHEEVAAWRAQQAQWKLEREAYRRQQSLAAQQVQQQVRVERERMRHIERERNAATRSNPLYTFVVIGISLIAGALTTMAFGGFVVAGLAATLAVLAIGIIINGVRGKRGGGATGFAWIVIVGLLIGTAVNRAVPIIADGGWATGTIVAADDARFDPRAIPGQADQTFAVGAGDVELDLRDYFADMTPAEIAAQPANQVNLYVGSGDVDVELPANLAVLLRLEIGNGEVSAADSTIAVAKAWRSSTFTFTAPGTADSPTLFVRIWVGNGDVDIDRTLEIGDNR